MIGLWIGDNWSNREGSVLKGTKRSSGKFGINNNDKENIERFRKGLKTQFRIKNIKLDVQVPRKMQIDKEKRKKRASRDFGICEKNANVYFGSPWRKSIGYAIYTNNTVLLRIITNEIYSKLPKMIDDFSLDVGSLMQGITDSEGTVDKANKVISITNKDAFVVGLVSKCLENLDINYQKRKDSKNRIKIDIRNIIEFNEKIGFNTIRKNKYLSEMLSGNYAREKDLLYLQTFKKKLKRGATAKDISKSFKIPLPTTKLVLRNLCSGKHVKRRKISKHYIYHVS
jgi:hypothetical protein